MLFEFYLTYVKGFVNEIDTDFLKRYNIIKIINEYKVFCMTYKIGIVTTIILLLIFRYNIFDGIGMSEL